MDSVGCGCENEGVKWNGKGESEGVGDVEWDQGQSAAHVLKDVPEGSNSGWAGLYISNGRLDGMADARNASNGAWRLGWCKPSSGNPLVVGAVLLWRSKGRVRTNVASSRSAGVKVSMAGHGESGRCERVLVVSAGRYVKDEGLIQS